MKKKSLSMDTVSIRKPIGIFFLLFATAILIWLAAGPFPIGRLFLSLGLRSNSPFDYPGTKWCSSDPEIELVISEEPDKYEANIIIDGEKTPVKIVIDPGQSAVVIYRGVATPSNYLMEGEILKATRQEIRFSISKDYCFSGEYASISLLRVQNND